MAAVEGMHALLCVQAGDADEWVQGLHEAHTENHALGLIDALELALEPEAAASCSPASGTGLRLAQRIAAVTMSRVPPAHAQAVAGAQAALAAGSASGMVVGVLLPLASCDLEAVIT